MLKKMLNSPERITYARLREVCELHVAEDYAKVRLADVLWIEGSGLSPAFNEFALQAHFDFVINRAGSAPIVLSRNDLTDFGRVLPFLGLSWDVV